MSRSRIFAVTFPIAVASTSPSVIFSPSRVRSVIEVMFFGRPFFIAMTWTW